MSGLMSASTSVFLRDRGRADVAVRGNRALISLVRVPGNIQSINQSIRQTQSNMSIANRIVEPLDLARQLKLARILVIVEHIDMFECANLARAQKCHRPLSNVCLNYLLFCKNLVFNKIKSCDQRTLFSAAFCEFMTAGQHGCPFMRAQITCPS